jgi:hypothetical protein
MQATDQSHFGGDQVSANTIDRPTMIIIEQLGNLMLSSSTNLPKRKGDWRGFSSSTSCPACCISELCMTYWHPSLFVSFVLHKIAPSLCASLTSLF